MEHLVSQCVTVPPPPGNEALSKKETDIRVRRGSSGKSEVMQTTPKEKEIGKKTYKRRVSKSVLTPTLPIWVMMRR